MYLCTLMYECVQLDGKLGNELLSFPPLPLPISAPSSSFPSKQGQLQVDKVLCSKLYTFPRDFPSENLIIISLALETTSFFCLPVNT